MKKRADGGSDKLSFLYIMTVACFFLAGKIVMLPDAPGWAVASVSMVTIILFVVCDHRIDNEIRGVV